MNLAGAAEALSNQMRVAMTDNKESYKTSKINKRSGFWLGLADQVSHLLASLVSQEKVCGPGVLPVKKRSYRPADKRHQEVGESDHV